MSSICYKPVIPWTIIITNGLINCHNTNATTNINTKLYRDNSIYFARSDLGKSALKI